MCKTSGRDYPHPADRISALLARFDPPARVVTVPWRDDAALQAYYLPPSAADPLDGPSADPPSGAPAVICVGETRSKEALFRLMARPVRARGLALLCVDLGSAGEAPLRGSIRPETCISALIDHLADTPGIDQARIAVVGDGSASSLVARGVAADGRAAAAVCDGGLWESWAGDLAPPSPMLLAGAPAPFGLAMPCPTLIPLRPHGGIDPSYARELLSHRPARRSDDEVPDRIDLGTDLAAESGPWIEPILDWVRDRLCGPGR